MIDHLHICTRAFKDAHYVYKFSKMDGCDLIGETLSFHHLVKLYDSSDCVYK